MAINWTSLFDLLQIMLAYILALVKSNSNWEKIILANSFSTFIFAWCFCWHSLTFFRIQSSVKTFSQFWCSSKRFCSSYFSTKIFSSIGSSNTTSMSLSFGRSLANVDRMVGPCLKIPIWWSLFMMFPMIKA